MLGVPRVPADGNEVMDGANMFASRFLFISQSFDVESHEKRAGHVLNKLLAGFPNKSPVLLFGPTVPYTTVAGQCVFGVKLNCVCSW